MVHLTCSPKHEACDVSASDTSYFELNRIISKNGGGRISQAHE